MIIHKGQIFDNLDNVPRTESRTTTWPIEQEEGRKRKKEIKREREKRKPFSPRRKDEKEETQHVDRWFLASGRGRRRGWRETRLTVNRERTLPRYRGLDSKFKSYYPVDAIRRGLELGGWKGAEGGREGGGGGGYI